MADKATILQNAQIYTSKGLIDKAIEEWQKLITESPNDGNIFNTIGDLYLKKHNTNQAVEAYLKGGEAFQRAGFALKTLAVYKKLIKLAPHRIDIQVRLGDVNAERGLTSNAVQDYLSAAKLYTQGGRVKEALSIYRKVADLDPSNTAVRLKLAEMCMKEGLKQDAISEYVKLAEHYKQNNLDGEFETVRNHIIKLDPNNEAVRRLTGQTPAEPAEASLEQRLAEVEGLMEKESYEMACKNLAGLIQENPDNPVVHQKLGVSFLKLGKKEDAFGALKTASRLFIGQGEFGQAGITMKDYLELDPDCREAHTLLAEAYERGGNPHLAVNSYATVIDEYLASGEIEPALEIYNKIKTLDPKHRDVRRLRHTFETAGVPMSETARPDPIHAEVPVEGVATTYGGEMTTPDPVIEEEIPGALVSESSSIPAAPAKPVVPADQAVLQGYFAEAEVYVKYGMSQKAIEQLEQVLLIDPDNAMANEQLKDIYKNDGYTDRALEKCLLLIEIYGNNGDSARRAAVLEEATALDPENPLVKAAADVGGMLKDERMDSILREDPALPVTEPTTVEFESPAKAAAAPPFEALQDLSLSAASRAENSLSGSLSGMERTYDDVAEQLAEADFYFQQGLKAEAKRMYLMILSTNPMHQAALRKLEAFTQEEQALQEVKGLRETLSETGDFNSPRQKSIEELALEGELEKSFSVYMTPDTGEAAEAGASAPSVEPSTVASTSMEEALGTPRSASKPGEEFVDISKMIGEEVNQALLERGRAIGEEMDDLFSNLQKEPEGPSEDAGYETHYNLGIAYKEMGLVSEAISEFEMSLNGSDRYIDSSTMLAACQMESGNSQKAITLLEAAISDKRCDEMQSRWLRYDLASIYEKEGRREEALAVFQRILKSDRNFKDVAEKIKNLLLSLGKPAGVGAPKPSSAVEEDEDLDTMMDRMFGEAAGTARSPGGKGEGGPKDEGGQKDRVSLL